VLGDGALVGASAPYTLYVYTNNPTPTWVNAGSVTAGPKGDQGDPGPQGPPVPLSGSGVANTAARSDHNHDAQYAAKLKESTLHRIQRGPTVVDDVRTITVGSSLTLADNGSGDVTVDVDASKVAAAAHSHVAGDIAGGTFAAARIPDLDAGKITTGTLSASRLPGHSASLLTSGTVPIERVPVGVSASQVAAGNHTHTQYAAVSHTHTLGALFPLNDTVITSRLARTAPGNEHNAVGTLSPGHQVYNSGMTRTTDESWTYILSPNVGFCWFPTVAL